MENSHENGIGNPHEWLNLLCACERRSDLDPKNPPRLLTSACPFQLSRMAEFEELDSLTVTKESENMQRVELHLKDEYEVVSGAGKRFSGQGRVARRPRS